MKSNPSSMSKPFLALVALFALLSPGPLTGAEKRPTGKLEGQTFWDAAYGFTVRKYDNWKAGRIDNEDPAAPRRTRCIFTQKNVQVPSEWVDNEDKFGIPLIGIWVDTSDMVLEAYAAELADRKSKRASRKELLKDFPLLAKGTFIEQGPLTIDGQKAIVQHYRQEYEIELYSRASNLNKLKEDVLLGDVYLAKRGKSVYVFHFTCERAIYRTVNEEAKSIVLSSDFDPASDSTQTKSDAAPGE